MKHSLIEWNKTMFRNIFYLKRRLLRRLQGITRELLRGPNNFLEKLQVELWAELDLVLKREEILWFQKSRCKWLKLGDKNTRYFHGATIVRRRKNRILKLKNDNDEWVTE
uniref:Uncharacterized protein n=1 Tax=Cajanus cajan TaxID=3821 RepID=A0A151R1A4_CAJCA|nr:hypothetical protein KK1_042629 [Cajanus cajan]